MYIEDAENYDVFKAFLAGKNPTDMARRLDAFHAINTERLYQDNQRGNAKRHEGQPQMTPGEFILCMEKCLNDARGTWYTPDGGVKCLDHIRKVAALGVSCMEMWGAPTRT